MLLILDGVSRNHIRIADFFFVNLWGSKLITFFQNIIVGRGGVVFGLVAVFLGVLSSRYSLYRLYKIRSKNI